MNRRLLLLGGLGLPGCATVAPVPDDGTMRPLRFTRVATAPATTAPSVTVTGGQGRIQLRAVRPEGCAPAGDRSIGGDYLVKGDSLIVDLYWAQHRPPPPQRTADGRLLEEACVTTGAGVDFQRWRGPFHSAAATIAALVPGRYHVRVQIADSIWVQQDIAVEAR